MIISDYFSLFFTFCLDNYEKKQKKRKEKKKEKKKGFHSFFLPSHSSHNLLRTGSRGLSLFAKCEGLSLVLAAESDTEDPLQLGEQTLIVQSGAGFTLVDGCGLLIHTLRQFLLGPLLLQTGLLDDPAHLKANTLV